MPIKIVIANDQTLFQEGLALMLATKSEFELIGQATSGTDAWELIGDLQPDVAILDLTLSEPHSLDIAERMRESGLDTRIILLMINDDSYDVLQAEQVGITGYVLKNARFEELATAIRIVAAQGFFYSPAVQKRRLTNTPAAMGGMDLSTRELEVMRLIALGNSTKGISRMINISPRTVDTYRARLMKKVGARKLADIVRYAVHAGVI
ncbi:hypothetical protein CCR95_16955 [Thiocystis minor]|uniref:LuxR C-terminal-related transcriptional regulator n=1 Tax=Thiocystis minor TaxID=61597 RepID=UPI00191362FF|nr:response regulator transcription factor [Thiocystis minor]MBK5965722.1 hypothetical protein [Thiocystis minor]